jgi:hypothetical protein
VTSYLVCRTCGKYVGTGEAVKRAWCSDECTCTYGECITCGRFSLSGTGYDAEHCSRQCTVRYQILRKYGPEPVTVVSEV